MAMSGKHLPKRHALGARGYHHSREYAEGCLKPYRLTNRVGDYKKNRPSQAVLFV